MNEREDERTNRHCNHVDSNYYIMYLVPKSCSRGSLRPKNSRGCNEKNATAVSSTPTTPTPVTVKGDTHKTEEYSSQVSTYSLNGALVTSTTCMYTNAGHL